MADVNTVIDAANELFKTIPGIKRVFSEAPNVGPSADLPCVIPISSHVGHRAQANGYQAKDYTVKFLLLVTPYNNDLPVMEKKARPLADPVLDLFFQHAKLNDLADEIDHAFITDAEYSRIEYNVKQEYLGWTFTLTATIKTVLSQGF